MHGYPKSRGNDLLNAVLLSVLILSVWIWGCRSSRETDKGKKTESSLENFLGKYEDSFNPSDYDSPINKVKAEEKRQREALEAAHVMVTALPETIPGFRIQILFTQDIDQANQNRDSVAALLPEEWAYIVYDAPYYKVRVGNFQDRIAANPLLKRLISLGYGDAWIVPDYVIKNPPPKPPENFIEPEKPPQEKR